MAFAAKPEMFPAVLERMKLIRRCGGTPGEPGREPEPELYAGVCHFNLADIFGGGGAEPDVTKLA